MILIMITGVLSSLRKTDRIDIVLLSLYDSLCDFLSLFFDYSTLPHLCIFVCFFSLIICVLCAAVFTYSSVLFVYETVLYVYIIMPLKPIYQTFYSKTSFLICLSCFLVSLSYAQLGRRIVNVRDTSVGMTSFRPQAAFTIPLGEWRERTGF